MFKLLKYVVKKSPWYSFGLFISTSFIAALPLLLSWYRGHLFDVIVNFVSTITLTDTTLSATNVLNSIPQDVFNILGIVLVLMLVVDLMHRLSSVFERYLEEKLDLDSDYDFCEKMANLDMAFFDDPETNDLINKVNTKSRHIVTSFFINCITLFEVTLLIIFSFSILTILSPLIILLVLLITLPEAFVNAYFSKKSFNVWDSLTEKRRDAGWTSSYLHSEKSLKEIRLFRLVPYLLNRFFTLRQHFVYSNLKVINARSFWGGVTGILPTAGYGAILLISVFFLLTKKITIGGFSFYSSAVDRLQGALVRFFTTLARLYENALHADNFFRFMELKNKIISGNVYLVPSAIPPSIEFKNVSFKYPNSFRYALKNFNLKINSGEHLAIVGENGAGKTTLIKLLARFYDVTSGEILIDGHNIKDLNLDSWYYLLGALFQDYNFYHFDAKTNIGVGNIEHLDNFKNIVEASKLAGAHDFIVDYKDKYDQVLHKSFNGGIDPSIGQKQRISLARAFFNDSPVLILDEPTSAIDPKAEYEIFERLFEYSKDKTVLIVSHRFSTVRNASRIIVMDNGNIIEDGTHEELMKKKKGVYKNAFELQKKGYE